MVNLHASITYNVCKKFFIGKTVHQSVNQSLNGVAKPPPDKHTQAVILLFVSGGDLHLKTCFLPNFTCFGTDHER